jgi:hypothetical protein
MLTAVPDSARPNRLPPSETASQTADSPQEDAVSFRAVFIALVIGTALLVAAYTINGIGRAS